MNEEHQGAEPIYSSLAQPLLAYGAERSLALLNLLAALFLILVSGFKLWPMLLGVTIGTFGHWCLCSLARSDPQMSEVYTRHVRYQRVYLARGTFHEMRMPHSGSF